MANPPSVVVLERIRLNTQCAHSLQLVSSFPATTCSINMELRWHRLPIELVHEILLYMAFARRADACSLCLVSSSVRRLVLPCLYRSVLLREAEHASNIAALFAPRRNAWLPPAPKASALSVDNIVIYSLALAVPNKRPSIEQALESMAGKLGNVTSLAISAQLLAGHGYWLRRNNIRPRMVMLYHLGCPHPVNFSDAYFGAVTHLYTSTLSGFHSTSLRDLTALTHVALSTRAQQSDLVMNETAVSIVELLHALPHLQMLVFSIGSPASHSCSHLRSWFELLSDALRHPRFFLLPYVRRARLDWRDVADGRPDVFARAREWRMLANEPDQNVRSRKMEEIWAAVAQEDATFVKWKDAKEWDLDLHQAPGFIYGKSGVDWDDVDTPIVNW